MNDETTAREPTGAALTCRELIGVIADYLEETLAPDAVTRVHTHLENCHACQTYLATYRRTRDLAADAQRVEMPDEMKARLRVFLLSELRDTGGDDRD